jgi:hypothetical protein
MKKILSLLIGLVVTTSLLVAQSAGTLTLEVTDVSSDDPQIAQMAEMMKGNTMTVVFEGKKSFTEMNMMGGMVAIQVLSKDNGDVDMLMNMMGQKMYIPTSKLEQEKVQAQSGNTPEFTYTYDESDTKEIAGFPCYKMTVGAVGNEDFKVEAYITEKLKIDANVIQGMKVADFKGFPLEYTMGMGPMSMTFTTTKFDQIVDASKFELNASGYTKMTLEEFTQTMQSMGAGGFGF